MNIIVPEPKRLANLAKHGIDLNDFETGFSWHRYAVLPAKPSRTGRVREVYIGRLSGIVVAAITSPLGSEAVAIISIRPASSRERAAYDAQR